MCLDCIGAPDVEPLTVIALIVVGLLLASVFGGWWPND